MIYNIHWDFKKMVEYRKLIKKSSAIFIEINSLVKPSLLSYFFHLNLHLELEQYTFQMVNFAKT